MSDKYTVIPNMHPSGVIRSKNKWESLFINALEQCKPFILDDEENSMKTKWEGIRGKKIRVINSRFHNIMTDLKENGYKLIDVQRYRQGEYQGIFAIVRNENNIKYLIFDDFKLEYYKLKSNDIPLPLKPIRELEKHTGPTIKEILHDRYKALKQKWGSVCYNYDFQIDDYIVYIIKEYLEDPPEYKMMFFDIEVHSENVFPNERDANFPISAISICIDDRFYQIYNKELLCDISEDMIMNIIKEQDIDIGNYHLFACKNETDTVRKFIEILHKERPDVLTAWNIYFDINYLANRSPKIGIDLSEFSPLSYPMYPSSKFGHYIIPGIIVSDLLEIYKSYERKKSKYTLDFIAEITLGIKKVSYEGSLADLLKNDPNRYIAYSSVDTKLIQMIEDKTGDFKLHLMIKDLSWVSYRNSFSTLAQIDGLMYQYAKKKGLALRQKPYKTDKTGAYIGAFVREPRKGLIPYVIDLDASSMYPSIMISLRISPETFVGYINNVSQYEMEKILLTNEKDNEIVTLTINPNMESFGASKQVEMKVSQLKDMIKEKNLIISFNGTIFVNKDDAFLPNILDDLITRRKKYKKQMLEFKERGNKELAKKYNLIQKTLKVLANSIYGATGNSGYRFFDIRLSTTITLTGQYEILFVSGLTEEYIKHRLQGKSYDIKLFSEILRKAEGQQHYVFYSDTDSSFIDIFDLLINDISDSINKLNRNNFIEINGTKHKISSYDDIRNIILKYMNDGYTIQGNILDIITISSMKIYCPNYTPDREKVVCINLV